MAVYSVLQVYLFISVLYIIIYLPSTQSPYTPLSLWPPSITPHLHLYGSGSGDALGRHCGSQLQQHLRQDIPLLTAILTACTSDASTSTTITIRMSFHYLQRYTLNAGGQTQIVDQLYHRAVNAQVRPHDPERDAELPLPGHCVLFVRDVFWL